MVGFTVLWLLGRAGGETGVLALTLVLLSDVHAPKQVPQFRGHPELSATSWERVANHREGYRYRPLYIIVDTRFAPAGLLPLIFTLNTQMCMCSKQDLMDLQPSKGPRPRTLRAAD